MYRAAETNSAVSELGRLAADSSKIQWRREGKSGGTAEDVYQSDIGERNKAAGDRLDWSR